MTSAIAALYRFFLLSDIAACLLCATLLLLNPIHYTAAKAEPINHVDLLNHTPPVAGKHIAYGEDPNQFAELVLPDGPGPHPVIVMIHGGCWQASISGLAAMTSIAEDMRTHGFAVWNMEYRRLGNEGAGYPGTFLDIANGMDYLRKVDHKYNLDIKNIMVVGHSAGGHLALWAAARRRIKPTSALYRPNPLPVKLAVSLAGINDLRAYQNSGPGVCGGPGTIDRLINTTGRLGQDPYADTSPAAMLPLNVRQLIVSGSLDSIVPSRFGKDYGALAQASGDPVKIMEIEGAGHSEFIDPASQAWMAIRARLLKH